MSTAYTEAEIWTKIRALDIDIAALRDPDKPIHYKIGSKSVNQDKQLEWALEERKRWVAMLEDIAGTGFKLTMTPTDYEMTDLGEQIGEVDDGS